MSLQPLRVISGWTIEWNTFMEKDPDPNDMSALSGSSLLYAFNEHSKRAINLEWRPEDDFEGEYILSVINLYEEFNPSTQKIDLSGMWGDSYYEYRSKERLEIVSEIERLMLQLPPYEDLRIMKSAGIVDEVAESLRLKLSENVINDTLIDKILSTNNKKLQDLLIDHEGVTKSGLKLLLESGASKGVRNKAQQKLNSKAFRDK